MLATGVFLIYGGATTRRPWQGSALGALREAQHVARGVVEGAVRTP